MDPWQLVRDEREDILVFLQSLTPEQWEAASLCEGWRVRDVAVHLLVDEPLNEVGIPRALLLLARWRFSIHRVNAWWIDRNRDRSTASIVGPFEQSLEPGRVSHLLGPSNQIRASVIHHQDMRRPLGMHRTIPAERLVAVLDHILRLKGSVNLGSADRASGLRLHATDLNWVWGERPEVSGPGEALMMAVAGRGSALADLSGGGKEILAGRVGSSSSTADAVR